MDLLSFAAVGSHGRESWLRLAAACALCATLSAQSPVSTDIATELATRIEAAAAPSRSIVLSTTEVDADLRAAIVSALRARGVSIVELAGSTAIDVRVSCGTSLRDRQCLSEIVKGGERTAFSVTRPRNAGSANPVTPSLELRPLVTLRDPILDVVIVGDDLLVLQPSAVSTRPRAAAAGVSVVTSAPIPPHHWPRDLRGRLRAGPGTFDAFLPGVTCRGRLRPLAVACSEEREAWPIAIDNDGIAATRNYFLTPEGFAFFSAASVPQDGRPRWLAVDRVGVMTFLDDRRSVSARAGTAEDVVALRSQCGGPYVAAATHAEAPPGGEFNADDIRLFRVAGDRLNPISSVPLAGIETALWPDADAATLVVRNVAEGSSRYEAFHVSLSCAR
jgi:hypothetical protein